jgi:ATP-dependent Clp protease protease subunit
MESDHPRKKITIRLHSFGGSIHEALAVIGRIKSSSCWVDTEAYGACMSATTIILACGDVSKMSKYAWYMHHEPSYGIYGRHSENRATVKQTEREWRLWAEHMADFTGKKDAEFWYETGVNVDAYFTPEQCLELGIVGELI